MRVKYIFLSTVMLLSIFSCNKNEDSVPEMNISITADVDGISFLSSKKENASYSDDVLMIEGSDWVNNRVFIKINNITAPGAFNIKTAGEASFIFSDDIETEYSTSTDLGSGTVTINELSETKVSGTFAYMASLNGSQRLVEVSQGKFSAEF